MIKINLISKKSILLLIAIVSVLVLPSGLATADNLTCPPPNDCSGTRGNDVITGNDNDQSGQGANKVMKGLGGDDILIGLGGDDILEGGIGDDELVGDENIFDSPRGEGGADGNDKLDGAGGADYMTGSGGFDILTGGVGAGRDQMWGGPLADQMTGGNGGDDMDGGPGDDFMFGGNGPDYMTGGPGDDRLEGGNGADIMFGGEGDDVLISDGDSYVNGGPGFDICFVVFDTDIVVECEDIRENLPSEPTITLNGANPQIIVKNAAYVELDAICNDPQDGDISGNLVIDSSGVDTSTIATYSVTYNCDDNELPVANAAAQVTRTVEVVAGDTPVITLGGDSSINIIVGGPAYVEPIDNVCFDTEDGDISGSLVLTGDTNPDESTIAIYVINYDCTDSSDNDATTVMRTINVVADGTSPTITLNGVTPITLVKNVDPYVELGATCFDPQNMQIDANVVISGAVDTSTIATYAIDYDCDDNDVVPNAAPTVTRTVHVVAGQAPTLTLTGASVVDIVTGSAVPIYNEDGATCNDPEEGDITANVIIVETPPIVDAVATYNVTYTCQDVSGNDASPISRTVNVIPVPTVTVQPMINQIQGLVDADPSLMTQKNANQLLNPLNSAEGNFADGDFTGACNNMSQFDNKVNKAIDQDKIPIGEGVDLLNQSATIQLANCV